MELSEQEFARMVKTHKSTIYTANFFVAIRIYRKMQHTNNELITQIREFSNNE